MAKSIQSAAVVEIRGASHHGRAPRLGSVAANYDSELIRCHQDLVLLSYNAG
jgi:hypothetical protein